MGEGLRVSEAALGDELTVDTMTGRRVTGRLTDVNPGYSHTFGRPTPELVRVGRDLRARLAEYHAVETAGTGE